MCTNCAALAKAIDAYLAKADIDLEKQLEREGFILPKLTVEFINVLEEEITKALLEETALFVSAAMNARGFEIPEGEPSIDASTLIYTGVVKSAKLAGIDRELEEYREDPNWRRYIFKSADNTDDVIDLKKFAKYIFPNLIYSDTCKDILAGIFRDMLGEYMPKLIEAYIKQTDRSLKLDAISQKTTAWVKSWSAELGSLMQLMSHRQLQNILVKGLNEGIGIPEFTRRIKDSGIRNEYYRARRVAVTEVLRAHNVSAQEAYEQSPAVTKKRWRHTGSYRNTPRENHVAMDGQTVDVDKPFTMPGLKGGVYYPMFPIDPCLPPEETINCHCISQPIVDEAILGLSLEEREGLQRKTVGEMDDSWKKELDERNKRKAEEYYANKTTNAPGANSPDKDGQFGFMYIRRAHTRDEDLAQTNPNYTTGLEEWTQNCQLCVSAYEARCRGFDVTAKPRIKVDDNHFTVTQTASGWTEVYKDGKKNLSYYGDMTSDAVKNKIESDMLQWGDGSRAVVWVCWKKGGSHVFIAENINGTVKYIDPQNNDLDVSWYFKNIKPHLTYLLRIDNLEFTDTIKECCEDLT